MWLQTLIMVPNALTAGYACWAWVAEIEARMESLRLGGGVPHRLLFCNDFCFSLGMMPTRPLLGAALACWSLHPCPPTNERERARNTLRFPRIYICLQTERSEER